MVSIVFSPISSGDILVISSIGHFTLEVPIEVDSSMVCPQHVLHMGTK